MTDSLVAVQQDTIVNALVEQDSVLATVQQETATVQIEGGIPGTPGTPGTTGPSGMVWHGAYDAGHAYDVHDAVSYDGQSYICILASVGNLPTNTTYWSLLAAKGADGVGSGDVVGPSSATDLHIAQFDGATGKLLKDGGVLGTMAAAVATDYVAKALFSAYTILTATTDNTPAALTVAEQTLVGRITGGAITALTAAQVRTLLGITAAGLELIDDAAASNQVTTLGFKSTSAEISKRVMAWKVIDDATVLTTGDGKVIFSVPPELTGMNLVAVFASVSTVSSSGLPTITIYNLTDSHDMLSTALTIDASEYSSNTAATAAVINTSYDDVVTGDRLEINVDGAGTGAKGLFVVLTFMNP